MLTTGTLGAPYAGELVQSNPIATEQEATPGSFNSDPTAVVPAAEQPAQVPAVQTDVPATATEITRLVIPGVGIDASIEVLGIDADGAMQSPSGPEVVAWYNFSSLPHEPGNAVFAGHLDYAGYGAAIFWRLGDVQIGDVVEVHHADGTIVRYGITSVAPYSASEDAGAVVTSRGRSEITLITCDGEFDQQGRAYPDRLVVSGDRID